MAASTLIFERLLRSYTFMGTIDIFVKTLLQPEDTNFEIKDVPELVLKLTHLLNEKESTALATLNKEEVSLLLNHFHDYIKEQLSCASFDEEGFSKMFEMCIQLVLVQMNFKEKDLKGPRSSKYNLFSWCR